MGANANKFVLHIKLDTLSACSGVVGCHIACLRGGGRSGPDQTQAAVNSGMDDVEHAPCLAEVRGSVYNESYNGG